MVVVVVVVVLEVVLVILSDAAGGRVSEKEDGSKGDGPQIERE